MENLVRNLRNKIRWKDFLERIKYDFIFMNDFKTIKDLKEGINGYITKYNYQSFHASINYQKSMQVVYLRYLKM